MDAAPGDEKTILNLTRRILVLNLAAINSSSRVGLSIFPNSLTASNKNVV